jgi:hypothetical protein
MVGCLVYRGRLRKRWCGGEEEMRWCRRRDRVEGKEGMKGRREGRKGKEREKERNEIRFLVRE